MSNIVFLKESFLHFQFYNFIELELQKLYTRQITCFFFEKQ